MPKKIIFLEFNELCPALLKQWMAEGRLPNFKAFYEDSECYITEADEKKPPHLEPWTQWYSIHTGLSFQQHGVALLTEGPKANHPDVWRILLANGKSVGNCSSMNAKGFEAPGSFFLPDPWCTSERPFPSELGIFHNIVARVVQEYTNRSVPLSPHDYFRFLTFLISHGLRLETVAAIARQIVLDSFLDKEETWRRAVLLDKLQFDLFRHYFRKLKPDFSTFFVNSTAHYQHAYWRHMAPESFSTTQPSKKERQRYGQAILFGYQQMDELLNSFVKLASDDVILILGTALSQQPFLRAEASGGQHYYRPLNMDSLLESLGIHPQTTRPVMTHQFLLTFSTPEEALRAKSKLRDIRYEGTEVFDFAPSNPGSLYLGSQIHSVVPSNAVITMGEVGTAKPFFEIFYAFNQMKSGCHHPDGVLWIKSGMHQIYSEKLSILEILPMILRHYGVGNEHGRMAHSGASPESSSVSSIS